MILDMREQLLGATDMERLTALVLIDLSVAFDTMSHQFLIARLQKCFGLGGTVLNSMVSFLYDRTSQG